MKAIFYNIFGLGHINPTLPLVKALIDTGMEVIYHSSPERRELIEQTGASFVNYGYDSYSASDFNPGKNFVLQTIPAAMGLLPFLSAEIERERPDLILYDSMAPWGYILSQIYQLPAICTVTTFALPYAKRAQTMASFGITPDETNLRALSTLKQRFGIELCLQDALGCYSDNNIVFTTKDFNPPLEELNPEHFHFMGAMVERSEDTSLFPELDSNKKTITMSLGTILLEEDPSVMNWYTELIKAFGDDQDYQLIMNAGKREGLPSNCFSFERIPQLHALKHSDVFIHHGGMNSINEGLHFNLPMLAIPHSKDQFLNAKRLVETGRGRAIKKEDVSAQVLRLNVLALLGPRT